MSKPHSAPPQRRFLFLQGVCSPFFARLAAVLSELGHSVSKVNFTVGDRIYWNRRNAIPYRGHMEKLPEFYSRVFNDLEITDVLLFGDCRPVHRPAIEHAKNNNVRVHVFEEGYFRPFWITMERDGVNAHSKLPRDPDWYRMQANHVPHYGNGNSFDSPFWKRAAYDLGYNFWSGLNPIFHAGVKSHVPYSPLAEYIGYLKRGARVKWNERKSKQTAEQLIREADANPFYLIPLQLANDAQIVHHSPYKSMIDAMHHILESFAKFAPRDSRLVVKIHPLDPGLIDYQSKLITFSRTLGLEGRVYYLESGNLPTLLSHATGVVTVNSTVGGSALVHGRPTIALGRAIYDLPGLTFQGGIDKFWTEKTKPDSKLFKNFRDVLVHKSQINGGFYSSEGISMAIRNCVPRLLSDS